MKVSILSLKQKAVDGSPPEVFGGTYKQDGDFDDDEGGDQGVPRVDSVSLTRNLVERTRWRQCEELWSEWLWQIGRAHV